MKKSKICENINIIKPTVKQCCSDYDNDCSLVEDPFKCFIGGLKVCKNGAEVYLPQADGYCPLTCHGN